MEIHIKDGETTKIVTTPTNMGKTELARLTEHATEEDGKVVIDVGSLQRMRATALGHAAFAGMAHFADAVKMCEEEYSPYPKADKPKRRARCNGEAKGIASEKKRVKRLKRKKQARKSQKRNRK